MFTGTGTYKIITAIVTGEVKYIYIGEICACKITIMILRLPLFMPLKVIRPTLNYIA